jgi:hypothetical protein
MSSDFIYRWIARRYKWFGKRSCRIPIPRIKINSYLKLHYGFIILFTDKIYIFLNFKIKSLWKYNTYYLGHGSIIIVRLWFRMPGFGGHSLTGERRQKNNIRPLSYPLRIHKLCYLMSTFLVLITAGLSCLELAVAVQGTLYYR